MCDFKESKSGAESWFVDVADASITGECLAVSFCAKKRSYASKDGPGVQHDQDEEGVVDLMCTEDAGDIEMALWESRRAKMIERRTREFFYLYEQERYTEAVDVGVWVLLHEGEDKVHYDTAVFQILKDCLVSAMSKQSCED
jgi:hypothetical protein